MTVHITKRLEIYDADEQSSWFVEEENEFGSVDIKIGAPWVKGEFEVEVTVSKEFAKQLVVSLNEIIGE